MAIRDYTSIYRLLAIGCVGLVLFSVAAMVVLALIPVYLATKSVTLNKIDAFQKTTTLSTPVASTTPLGTLSASEVSQMTTLLQSSQTGATLQNGALTVTNAVVVASSGRKRQTVVRILIITILMTGRNVIALNFVENHLNLYFSQNSGTVSIFTQQIITSRNSTTTISPTIISTTVPTGIISTTVPTGIVSTTVPSGIVSTTAPSGRRRRQAYEESSTSSPLVMYKD